MSCVGCSESEHALDSRDTIINIYALIRYFHFYIAVFIVFTFLVTTCENFDLVNRTPTFNSADAGEYFEPIPNLSIGTCSCLFDLHEKA